MFVCGLGREFILDFDKSRMDIVISREASKVMVNGWITMKLIYSENEIIKNNEPKRKYSRKEEKTKVYFIEDLLVL